MKKLISLFIILNIIIPNMVNAATYYGNERIRYLSSKPNINYEEEYRYKFYRKENIYSDKYYIEDENIDEYPYKSGESIETEYSSWSKEKPEEKKGRVIQTKTIYEYANRLPIRYLNFNNINGSRDILRFLEIKIFNNKEKIDYELICRNCLNKEKISDNFLNNGFMEVTKSQDFTIDLKDNYDIENINIEIYLTDNYGTDNTSFSVDILDNNKNKLKNYIDIIMNANIYNNEDNGYKLNILLKDYLKDIYYDENVITKEEKIDDPSLQLIDSYSLYSYKDIKYKYYKEERYYLDDYYVEKDGYIKDENKYRVYYKVKNRYMINFKDNYVIKSRDYNLYDVINDTNIEKSKIKIKDSININKNGLYKITYSYNDFVVSIYITLDLEEMMESYRINNNSRIKELEKISIDTEESVIKGNKQEAKKDKEHKNNDVFSVMSLSLIMIIKRVLKI